MSYLFKLPVEKVEVCSIEVSQRVVGIHRYGLLVVLHGSGVVSHIMADHTAVGEELVAQRVVLHGRQKKKKKRKMRQENFHSTPLTDTLTVSSEYKSPVAILLLTCEQQVCDGTCNYGSF